MPTQPSFKQIIDYGDLERIEKLLADSQSNITISEDQEILRYIIRRGIRLKDAIKGKKYLEDPLNKVQASEKEEIKKELNSLNSSIEERIKDLKNSLNKANDEIQKLSNSFETKKQNNIEERIKGLKNSLNEANDEIQKLSNSRDLPFEDKNQNNIDILKEVLNKLKNDVKDKVINRVGENREQTLFLALDAGADYLEAFEKDQHVNWSVFDKKGNHLLHYALSNPNISHESLDLIHEKLNDSKCLLVINDYGENALHCAAKSGNLTNFKWCLDKFHSGETPANMKSLLNSVNRSGETPVIELLKNKNLLGNKAVFKAVFEEIINTLKNNEYDFLKTDYNEQNAVSLAVENNYSELVKHLLEQSKPEETIERIEIIFSAFQYNKESSFTPSNKSDFILKNSNYLVEKHPKRFAKFIENDKKVLSDLVNSNELQLPKILRLAIKHKNNGLAVQCATRNPDLLTEPDSTGKTPLDYAAENNPKVFTELVKILPEDKLNTLLKNDTGSKVAPNEVSQKNSDTQDIAKLFTTDKYIGWYDTGGILTSLADLIVERKADYPIIFVQPGTYEKDKQQSLSNELKEVSKQASENKDVLYIRRNPTNENGESSAHWVVFYFFKDKDQKNLLIVDPSGRKPNDLTTKVVKDAVGKTINIHVSTTEIQCDEASCGPISSEVTRAIYFKGEELKKLLIANGNNREIDIQEILPNALMADAKDKGKVNYGQGFQPLKGSKVRNAHVRMAQATNGMTFDSIPTQSLIQNIFIGRDNALAEQTAKLGRDSMQSILDACKGHKNTEKETMSILTGKNIGEISNEDVDNFFTQDEITVNLKQIENERLEQILGDNFKEIKKRFNNQIIQSKTLQLSNEQKNQIKQIRKEFELELKSESKPKNKVLDSFFRSASAEYIKDFLRNNPQLVDVEKVKKVAFIAARSGDIEKLKVFVNHNNDILYKTDVSGKSLLEAAAENSHPEVVQYIMRKHNEIYKGQTKDNEEKTENDKKISSFKDNINKRNDSWAKDLAKVLSKALRNKDFNKSCELEIKEILNPDERSNEPEKTVDKNDYGKLQYYADVIKRSDVEKFKTLLEENSKPEHRLFSLLSHNDSGHSLVTLTAALGTKDHWKAIEKAYDKIPGYSAGKALTASLDKRSTIDSPIQAALIADNLQMFYHLFDLKNGFKINEQYGTEENNILHTIIQSGKVETIIQSGKVELFNDIFSKFKNKNELIEALKQVNKDNKSPLSLMLERGHYGLFDKALDLWIDRNTEDIAKLLTFNDCELIESAVKHGNEGIVEKIFNLQDKRNDGLKDKLNLLNHKDRDNTKDRTEESVLLNLACKHGNTETAITILKKEEKIAKGEIAKRVFVNALTASISSNSYNKEIFDLLFSQGIDFKDLSDGKYSPLHEAAKHGNIGALQYFIDRFPNDNTLDVKGENDNTPLHYAINHGNRKAVEFLIQNRADFNLSNKEGITPFKLVLQDSKFSDICIDLLDHKLIDIEKSDILGKETVLKFALRRGISQDLTAKLAYESIQNFGQLSKDQQKVFLNSGFLNDVLKSDIYGDGKDLILCNEFIKSQIEEDRALLNTVSHGTTLLYDIVNKSKFNYLFEAIKEYIESDDITKITSNELKETPLHAAVRSGNKYIVEALLERLGENTQSVVNQDNAEGYTPFQIAARSGNKEVYELLKGKGGDLKSKTKNGDSIAHLLILSGMKDADGSYEYKALLKSNHDLAKAVNHNGDSLLATAAKCISANKNAAPEIINQLLENEFERKRNQLTEENAVRLLANATSAGNFSAVREIVFQNIKGESKFVDKIADVTPTIGHIIFPSSQKKIEDIKKEKVLSQSIQKALAQPIDLDALCGFLVEDQNLNKGSRYNFPPVEEEVRVSSRRKDIIKQQEVLSQKVKTYLEQKPEKLKEEKELLEQENSQLRNEKYNLRIYEAIFEVIYQHGPEVNIKEKGYEYYFAQHPGEDPDALVNQDKTYKQCIMEDIEHFYNDHPIRKIINDLQTLQKDDQNERIDKKLTEINQAYSKLNLELKKNIDHISKLNEEIRIYKSSKNDLLKISSDALYTKALGGKSIADDIFAKNNSDLIALAFNNEELWDPRFVDSKDNTLLHKLGQIDKKFISLDFIKKFTDRGFSLIKKNNDGKSARDIIEQACKGLTDEAEANKITKHLKETALAEEGIQKHFEKGLDSLLYNHSTSYLESLSEHQYYGQLFKQYYGTIFNPFHSVVTACFNGDLSDDYLFKEKLQSFKTLLNNKDLSENLRSALYKTDEKRSNFLHKAIEEAIANHNGSDTNKMLDHILSNVASKFNDSRDPELYSLFFKQRNSEGDNVIEALSKVPGSSDIFKNLEEKLSKSAFAQECDLNLVLTNAASSKNKDLFEHVIEKYRLNRLRTTSENGLFPLHAAVISGDQETVLAVLKSGANINQINADGEADGETALHKLLTILRDNPNNSTHMGLVHCLVARGASFGQKDIDVVKDMDQRDKVLLSLANSRSSFHNLKYELLSEIGNFVKSKNKSKDIEIDLDIGGSVVFVNVKNGTFRSNAFLNSNVCQKNNLTTSCFDIDGSKGYVQKSASGKRNYVVSEDSIKVKVWWTPPNGKKESITVHINADGTIKASDKDLEKHGCNDLNDHEARKEATKQLVEKVDFHANEVYVGGIPLKDALKEGRWRRDASLNKQQPNIATERVQSPSNGPSPSPNRSRNSSGDTGAETIEEGRINEQADQMNEDVVQTNTVNPAQASREIENDMQGTHTQTTPETVDKGKNLYDKSLELAKAMKALISEGIDGYNTLKLENSIKDLMDQMSKGEAIKENSELHKAAAELSKELENLARITSNGLSSKARSKKEHDEFYNNALKLTNSLNKLITEVLDSQKSLSDKESAKSQKEYKNQSIKKEMPEVNDFNKRLPKLDLNNSIDINSPSSPESGYGSSTNSPEKETESIWKSEKLKEELKAKLAKTSQQVDKSGVDTSPLDRDPENFRYQVKAGDVTASTYKYLIEGGIKLSGNPKEKPVDPALIKLQNAIAGLKKVNLTNSKEENPQLSELEGRFKQPNMGLKKVNLTNSKEENPQLSELEERFKQPNMGLKKLDTKDRYISPETKERLGSLLDNKIDNKYLERSKPQSQTSHSQKLPNVKKQQAEELTDEKKRSFYEAIKDVAKSLTGMMDEIENFSSKNKKTELYLDLNYNMDITIPGSPESGYGSPGSPEKGTKDSLESEKNEDSLGEIIKFGITKHKVIEGKNIEKIIQEIKTKFADVLPTDYKNGKNLKIRNTSLNNKKGPNSNRCM